MTKADRSVVRNQAYRRGEFSIRERHNERKNISYGNGDIIPEGSRLNVHYKSCPATYEQEFSRMVDAGEISLRGLKPDARIFDELVFDVNSAYFEDRGGYEYAKAFYAEAYRLAVKEAGGEKYILSAVLHADERNRALSDQLGRDVFHYHLHVVYIPVVDKEIRWSKRCKDPALVGTVRETIKQVSHSKKWPRYRDDSGCWVNSYSLLQDRYYEHMRAAGYTDFERGERGSTADHLDTLAYKIKQDESRVAALAATVEQANDTAAALDRQAALKQKRLDDLEKKTAIAKKNSSAFADIDRIAGNRTILGNVAVSQEDWKTVTALAKEGQKSRSIIKELRKKNSAHLAEISDMNAKLKNYGEGIGVTGAMRYYQAKQRAPHRMDEIIADIMRKPPEKPQSRAPMRDAGRERE